MDKVAEAPVVETVTIAAIVASLGALTVETRGKLFSIGNKVFAFGRVRNLEADGAIVETIETEGTLQGLAIDKALIRRAMKASKDGKLANKFNVFSTWSAALTDKAAQEILDAAQGKARKASTVKSDLEKAMTAVGKLSGDVDGLRAILSQVRSIILKTQASAPAPVQKSA